MEASRRKGRLVALLERMRGGGDVSQRDLKNVLSPEQFATMHSDWESQQELRHDARQKPPQVIEYERRQKRLTFAYNKAEGYSASSRRRSVVGRDGRKTNRRLYASAETQCERLIEFLEEIVGADAGLCIWFDRPLLFGAEGLSGSTPEDMPRVVTSRSVDRKSDGFLTAIQPKRQVKQRALEEALAEAVEDERLVAQIAARIAEERAQACRAHQATQSTLRKFSSGRR